jgi:capsular exopolysaccharide synthesis family protein
MNETQFNLRQIISEALRYWFVFAIIFPIMIGLAFYYLKKTEPIYKAEVVVLIKDNKNSGQMSEEALFKELGIDRRMNNIENEILLLRSTPLMTIVVENLSLQYQYKIKKGLRFDDLYKNSPVLVLDWKPRNENSALYGFIMADNKGGYSIEVDKQKYNGEFGKPLSLPTGKVTFAHDRSRDDNGLISVSILPTKKRARALLQFLEIGLIGKESSTLSIQIKDTSPERAHDVLMELVNTYNQNSVDEKNQVYKNSIDLINERIQMIASELSQVESTVEEYKSRFSMIELSAEGSMLMNEIATTTKEISGKDVQLEILNSFEKFLVDNINKFEFVPTNASITNLTLTNQLSRFNILLTERARLRSDLGPSHPDLQLMERQIQNLRQTIIENIRSIKNDIQIASSATRQNKFNLESRLRSLPKRERELVEIERQKNIKENLYLYLLQKREESAISLAITAANGKLIEPAKISSRPVSPKKSQIWLVAIFLGLALPSGISLLLDSLNDKVNLKEDIERVTTVPMVSMIPYSRKKKNLIVKKNSRSVAAEMFRLLRTNLSYIIPGEELKTLLITSSMSGEGKTFIALNLGMTIALTGKKVLIIELDFRKPKQDIYLDLEANKKGIVNYLVDPNVSHKDIIRNSQSHLNLDIITRGAKPPNPGELILSPRLNPLLEFVKDSYDFIIFDTPPVGLVADALQMKNLAQATLFVVRAEVTRRGQLNIIEDIAQQKKLPKPFIVLNGVHLNGIINYGYNYGYSYGYGNNSENGYFEEDKEENLWQKIKKILPNEKHAAKKQKNKVKKKEKREKRELQNVGMINFEFAEL